MTDENDIGVPRDVNGIEFKPGQRVRRTRPYRAFLFDIAKGVEATVVAVQKFDYPLSLRFDGDDRVMRFHHSGWKIVDPPKKP